MPYKDIMNRGAEVLLQKGHNLSVAESVTSGLIQSAFSQAKHATEFFEGGITAYNINQKCTHLFIDEAHALECNCVSQAVAEQMARGVSKSFNTDWGIGITGYASPVPELNIKDLFAWAAISFQGNMVISRKLVAPPGHPLTVQEFYRDTLIKELSAHWLAMANENKEVAA